MDTLPLKLKPLEKYLTNVKYQCCTASVSINELAISYVMFNNNIDRVLVGVDDRNQLFNNLKVINYMPSLFNFIDENIFVEEIELLNPVNWE